MAEYNRNCFECESGVCHEVTEPYEVQLPDGDSFTIPSLSVIRCDACGEISISAASAKVIDAAILEYSETVSGEFLKSFLTQFNLDQTEAAESLGLGGKTFHRWVRGTQRVSRSMGFFLRSMAEFPETFEWIQNRQWRTRGIPALQQPVLSIELGDHEKFPAISRRTNSRLYKQDRSCAISPTFNAAQTFRSVKCR